MRQMIVTELVCAKCGQLLEVEYGHPKPGPPCAEGEPTGADMVQLYVRVSPCKTCVEPNHQVRRALRILKEFGEEDK